MAKRKPQYKLKEPFLFTCPECGEQEMLPGSSRNREMCKKCRARRNNEKTKIRAKLIAQSHVYIFACGCRYLKSDLPVLGHGKRAYCPVHGTQISKIERTCTKCGAKFSGKFHANASTCNGCRRRYNTSDNETVISRVEYAQYSETKRKPDCLSYNDCLSRAAHLNRKSMDCTGCKQYQSVSLDAQDYTWCADSMQTTGRHNVGRPL